MTQHLYESADYVPPSTESTWLAMAAHWGVIMGYGVVSLGLGVVLAVWPDETLTVCAVLIGIQLLVGGVLRVVMAIASPSLDGGVRVLVGLTGGLALVVGLLCLRDPVQTLLVITLLLGVWWVASGVVDVITAVVAPVPGRRVWDVLTGVISILAGGFLLVNPELSLGVLVFVTCAWLIITGLVAVVTAIRLRSTARGGVPTQIPRPTPPAPAL